MSRCIHHVAYLANNNISGVVATCVPLLGVLLEDLNELCQTVDSAIHLAQLVKCVLAAHERVYHPGGESNAFVTKDCESLMVKRGGHLVSE